MDRPEVWMSGAATPPRRSTAVIDRTAEFAARSAAATEVPLVCTPIDSASWFGTPDAFPVPVTVIRVPPWAGAAAVAVSAALPVAPPAVPGAALPRPAPRVNAPISSPADATPTATARWVEENWTAMVPLPRHSGMGHRLDAPAARPVPGSRRSRAAGPRRTGQETPGPRPGTPAGTRAGSAPLGVAEGLGQLRDALHQRRVLANLFLRGGHRDDRGHQERQNADAQDQREQECRRAGPGAHGRHSAGRHGLHLQRGHAGVVHPADGDTHDQ